MRTYIHIYTYTTPPLLCLNDNDMASYALLCARGVSRGAYGI